MALNGITPEQLAIYMTKPAAKPPYGVTPNFGNPPTLQLAVIILIVTCLLVTTFFVTMRIYTRHIVVKKLWWDDWKLLYPSVGGAVISFIIADHGGGVHQWNLHYSDFIQINYDLMVAKALYIVCILAVKVSILLQYLRIFVPTRLGNAVMFYGATGLIVTNVLFYIIEFFLDVLQCSPRARIWNRSVHGTCIGSSNIVYTAGFNVISDFVILFLPLYRIWRLQMPMNRKIGITLIFCVGIVACATSIMRLYYSVYVLHTPDKTFYDSILGFWLYAELTVGIIVGCMPTLPKFITQMRSTWGKAWTRISSTNFKPYLSRASNSSGRDPWTDPYNTRRHLKDGGYQLKVSSNGELNRWRGESLV